MDSTEYHKIHSLYMRDERGKHIDGVWSRPEIGYLAGLQWEWTEKVDGTNIRIGTDEARPYWLGGRTNAAQIPASLLGAIDALGLRDRLAAHFDGPAVLYGEGYGAKIQKGGGNYRPDNGFVLFDVRVGRWWLTRADVEKVGTDLGLDVVPVVGTGTLHEAIARVRDGMRSTWGDFTAEGLVCRPVVPLFGRDGSRVIVKVKAADLRKSAA